MSGDGQTDPPPPSLPDEQHAPQTETFGPYAAAQHKGNPALSIKNKQMFTTLDRPGKKNKKSKEKKNEK